jgi:SH3-like domain-containing protein
MRIAWLRPTGVAPTLLTPQARFQEKKPMKWVNVRGVASRVIAVGVLLVAYPVVGAISAELNSIPSGAVACEGSVYTADPDPKGINVRSAPHKESPVILTVPYDPEGTVVALAASSGNWVLIHSAQGMTSGFEFRGEGWVHASLFALRAVHRTGRKVPLYSEPDIGSPVIRMVGETETRLAGCMADWMRVRIGKQTGWLARGDYCGNPVTTCP